MAEDKKNKKNLIQVPTGNTEAERREKAVLQLAQVDEEYQQYLARIPQEKKDRIDKLVGRTRNSLHSIAPLVCRGPAACPFIENCPIPEKGPNGNLIYGSDSMYPMYQSCVYERFYMQQKVIDYVQHLEVDPDNPIEMAIVNDLAVIDLYKNRAMLVLARGDADGNGRDFLRIDVKEQQGEHGLVLEKKTQLHPAADYIEKLEKRRNKMLVELMETRKSKADMKLRMGNEQSSTPLVVEIKRIREALAEITESKEDLQIGKDEDPLYIDDK